MNEFKSIDDVLDFAIAREEESHKMYTDLAGKMKKQAMKEVFEDFAKQELGHKAKLLKVKEGKLLVSAEKKVMDLKIGDYLVDVEPTEKMSYQDALIVAMKKERAAFMLYSDLAESVSDENLKNTFTSLANEEARHKLRFEIIYDDKVLVWN